MSPAKKFYQVLQKQEHQNYLTDFSAVLQDENTEVAKFSSPNKKTEEEEEEKMREQHLDSIIKNNGWKNSFECILSSPKQIKQSFHAGGEEVNLANREVKLEKLGKIGRREVAMSILP